VTVWVTVNRPGVRKVCPGLRALLVSPSPKFQAYARPATDRSVKYTVNGARPDVAEAAKPARGRVGWACQFEAAKL